MSARTAADVTGFLDRVNEEIGREAVTAVTPGQKAFIEDARAGHGEAAAIARPRSTLEVSLMVRHAQATGVRLIPQGANTGLVAAGIAADGSEHVVLSLRSMNRPPQIDAANRTATVDAGVLLSKLNAAAGEFDLCLPIDLAADPAVGGMIAANAAGARFVRYGDVRRSLLGLEVVLGDANGTVLDLMTPLWKNNTGLDLKQLFVGSSGSLGIITRAVLALQPRPNTTVTALLVPVDETAVIEALLALERYAGAALSAFEGMSRAAMQSAIDEVKSIRDPFAGAALPEFAVLVELSGVGQDTEARLLDVLGEALLSLSAGPAPRITSVLVGEPERLWALRHAIPEALRKRGQVVACDIAVARGDWVRLRARLTQVVRERWQTFEVCDFGHVGDGGLHFNLVWPAHLPPAPDGAVEAVRAQVFAIVTGEFGGAFSAEHGIGPRNAAYYRQYKRTDELALAGSIQGIVCPAGIGRVDFGFRRR